MSGAQSDWAWIDWAIVFAFVAYGLFAGLRSRRQASRDLNEYFLAGKTLGGVRAGLSMSATQFAADTPLLVMGLIAVGGVSSLWRLWIYGLAFLLMGFLLGKAWRRAGVLTDAELTMLRYSERGALALRAMKAVYYGTVINCVVMAFVLIAAVRIFEIFLPWHEWLPAGGYAALAGAVAATGLEIASGVTGLDALTATTNNLLSILAILVFVAFYSTTGGLRSVVATDVMQLGLMLGGTLAYAIIAVREAGGHAQMLERIDALYGEERADALLGFLPSGGADVVLPFLLLISLQWFFQMYSDGTGYLAQRTMACRSDRQARIAGATFTLTQIVVRSVLWLAIGVALLVVYPFDPGAPMTEAAIAERETLFALGINDLLGPGLRGLMLTAMLAALASTLDTHLNWGASYWSNDLYKGVWVERIQQREAGPRELVVVARLSNLVILTVALVIMVNLGSIQTAWQMSLLFGAGVGAVLVLRWLWERVNLYSEFGAMAVSLLLAPVLILTVEAEWLKLALMALASTAIVFLTAYYAPATEPHRLRAFFERVRPPGWWRQSAADAGVDPALPLADLRRDVRWIAACAISTYTWLVAAGKLFVAPDEWPLAVALLAAGIAAVPFWWPAVARNGD